MSTTKSQSRPPRKHSPSGSHSRTHSRTHSQSKTTGNVSQQDVKVKSRSQTPVRGGWAAAARGSLNKKAAVKQGSEEVVEIKPFNRQEVRDFLADKYQYYLGKVDKARKEDISIYKSLEGGWGKTSKKGKESNSSVEILNEIARQIE